MLPLYHVPGDKVSLEDLGRDELRSDLNEVGRLLLPRAQILLQLIVRKSQQLLLVLLQMWPVRMLYVGTSPVCQQCSSWRVRWCHQADRTVMD